MSQPNVQAAVDELARQLEQITGRGIAEVMPLAEQFGPAAAEWAVEGRADDLDELHRAAVMQAAVIGIRMEAAGEQAFKTAIEIAGRLALRV
jgi:hypothetical protein